MIDLIAKANCPGWEQAQRHLRQADPLLRSVIDRVGGCTLAPRGGYFACLCQSIVSQQISTAVAMTIFSRFRRLFISRRPVPRDLLALTDDALRAAGLSRQKIRYLRHLAEAFESGQIPLRRFRRMDDEQIIASLTPIHGIGRWTAEMFLIFVLNRTDLLPVDDFGLRKSVQNVYRLGHLPDAATLQKIAEPWRPYRSIATWYLWRSSSLD